MLAPLLIAGCMAVPVWAASPEQIAIAYLSREAERWRPENGCFSCHNNGDAARALYAAMRQKRAVPGNALDGTTQFLSQPSAWDQKKTTEAFSDKQLARVQFASAAAAGFEAGAVTREAAREAVSVLLPLQAPDGSWPIDTGEMPGAPATYGTALATALAHHSLNLVDASRFAAEIQRAGAWLRALDPTSVPDAAAALLADPNHTVALALIERFQTPGGGWGPRLYTPAEAFDTAVALLALARTNAATARSMIERGRAYLLKTQQKAGGWPETTRPAGAQSYAQHISTSAWATLALLATDPERH